MFEFRIDFPLKKIGLMLWINEIVYKNMLQMLEEEFFKMEMYVIIVIVKFWNLGQFCIDCLKGLY